MGRSAANRRIAKERAAEQARRDAAFFENFKRNEIDSFVRAGDARQVANTYGRTESGLSNIPPAEGQEIIDVKKLNPDFVKEYPVSKPLQK